LPSNKRKRGQTASLLPKNRRTVRNAY